MEAYFNDDPRIQEGIDLVIEKLFTVCLLSGPDAEAEFRRGRQAIEKIAQTFIGMSIPSLDLVEAVKQLIEQRLPDARVINNFPTLYEVMEEMITAGIPAGTQYIEKKPIGREILETDRQGANETIPVHEVSFNNNDELMGMTSMVTLNLGRERHLSSRMGTSSIIVRQHQDGFYDQVVIDKSVQTIPAMVRLKTPLPIEVEEQFAKVETNNIKNGQVEINNALNAETNMIEPTLVFDQGVEKELEQDNNLKIGKDNVFSDQSKNAELIEINEEKTNRVTVQKGEKVRPSLILESIKKTITLPEPQVLLNLTSNNNESMSYDEKLENREMSDEKTETQILTVILTQSDLKTETQIQTATIKDQSENKGTEIHIETITEQGEEVETQPIKKEVREERIEEEQEEQEGKGKGGGEGKGTKVQVQVQIQTQAETKAQAKTKEQKELAWSGLAKSRVVRSSQVPAQAERLAFILRQLFPNSLVCWNLSLGKHTFLAQVEDILIDLKQTNEKEIIKEMQKQGWRTVVFSFEDLAFPRRMEREIRQYIMSNNKIIR